MLDGVLTEKSKPDSRGVRNLSQGNRGIYLNSLRDQRQKERNDKIQFFNANKDVMLPLEREVIKGEINLLQFEIMKINEKIKLENQR